MADTNVANDKNTLSPLLGGLSRHLVAEFYEVKKDKDGGWSRAADSVTVKAPFTESNLDVALGWQSPFENSGTEHGMPALSAMLQSGALMPWVGDGKMGSAISQFEGRTGVTKLNSTQVFSGMVPVKIQVTALFRAWRDPVEEVEKPFNKLMEWALPRSIAPDGAFLSMWDSVKNAAQGNVKLDQATAYGLFPSEAPICIALKYKNRTISPLVIEQIGFPMNSPIDANGHYVELLIPMTLCSLTAWDRKDWTEQTVVKK